MKKIFASFVIISVLSSATLVVADDVTDVQTRVTQIKTTDPTLPAISEQKGLYGTILSKLFDANGKIRDIFLAVVGSVSNGDVPRWDGSQFVSGVLTDDGTNVGIGVPIPSHKLDVNGSIRAQGRYMYLGGNQLYGDDGSAVYHFSNNDTVSQLLMADKQGTLYGRLYGASDGIDFGLIDGDGDWGIRMNKDVYTSFLINDSEKMRITASGRLGIGVPNPGSALDVSGNANIDGFLTATYDIQTSNNMNANKFGIVGTSIATPAGNGGLYSPANGQIGIVANTIERVRIDASGNVGIGETNPGTKLHVKSGDSGGAYVSTGNSVGIFESDATAFIDVTTPGTSSAGIRFDTGGDSEGYVAYDGAPDNLRFGTNANDRMVITGDGQVGIGTPNPTFADWPSATGLHIQGSRAVLGLEGTTGARKWDVGVDNTGQFNIYDDTANSTRFWIDTSGNTRLSNWLYLGTGGEGIYSATNSAHFYPNTVSDYGTWRIHGTRGGYAGINYNNATTMMLHDSHAGFYNDADNEWLAYGTRNGPFYLMYNGSTKLETRSDGVYTYGAHYASSFIYTSDERLKKDIQDISGLDIVENLRGVKFRWKENNKETYGLIAQEVENVLPELVRTDEFTGMKSVEYGNLVAPLIEAVKEQQVQIEDLQKQIEQLQK